VATSLTLSAAGGTAGQYRWYTAAAGGTAIAGQTNNTYITPILTTTTTYYVSINNGTCESARTPVVATITSIPSAPATTGNSSCGPAAITLTAAGGTAGQYRWYTVATGGTALTGQTNNTYTTPVITTTTTYYVSINNGTCEGARAAVIATINTQPVAPTTTGNSSCGAAAITLNATGGTTGQFRWYTVPTGGTAIVGQTSNTYTTPVITTTTTYYVSINNGTCESPRTAAIATIITPPAKPSITSSEPITGGIASLCLNPITLTAPAGFTSYTWSNGQTSQQITTIEPGKYSVVVREVNGCASVAADTVQIITSVSPTCINNPPVISSASAITTIGGSVSIDLAPLLSDPDNNLNLASLQIVGNGTEKGGTTSLDGLTLDIDYNDLKFAGEDNVTIRICDLLNVCIEQLLTIEVIGDINVYNGISPNGDGRNDTWIIEYIQLFPDTQKNRVTIYNRWGDVVWEASDYNNSSVIFDGQNKNGSDLSTGSYFYKIEFPSGRDTITGYLSIKR
jgi:gliding motility-associated-like protein